MIEEKRIREIGEEIFSKLDDKKTRSSWDVRALLRDWALRDEDLKREILRFVDVLPVLHSSESVGKMVREHFSHAPLSGLMKWGMNFSSSPFLRWIAAPLIKRQVSSVASEFIAGENANQAWPVLKKMWNEGMCCTLDLLGESVLSETEADQNLQQHLKLITELSQYLMKLPDCARLDEAPWGKVPRLNISLKLSGLYSQLRNVAFDESGRHIRKKLRLILREAMNADAFVNIDMEQDEWRPLFHSVIEKVFCEQAFSSYPHLGFVLQAYLKSSERDLDEIIKWASTREAPLTIRLVKGAYWDYEVARAQSRGQPIPVFLSKAETDQNFEKLTEKIMENYPRLIPALGTHNVRSVAVALSAAERFSIPKNGFEIQMLYGMADVFKKALSEMDIRVRQYVPIGESLPGMAYLVRRLLENTSNVGFLVGLECQNKSRKELLAPPLVQESHETADSGFVNEAHLDFANSIVRQKWQIARDEFQQNLPLNIYPVVGEIKDKQLQVFERVNPSQQAQKVGLIHMADESLAHFSVDWLAKNVGHWSSVSWKERATILKKAADLIIDQRFELMAVINAEVAKIVEEADAEVVEAADFCRYYAEQMEKIITERKLITFSGEHNRFAYNPRGIALVLSPWNFPLAIPCGMIAAALVTGNQVIFKPAEQASVTAYKLFHIFRKAGVPESALVFLPGEGHVVGDKLSKHPAVKTIAFTGSREVGLGLIRMSPELAAGQRHVKRIIAEMGGKNAIYVDESADLDEAVAGVLKSAFGMQGQKCSAASRVFVHERVAEIFRKRLIDAMHSLPMGAADDPLTIVSAVIDAENQERLLDIIRRHEAEIVAQVTLAPALRYQGFYVPPTLFETREPQTELMQDELFGPLLTMMRVKTIHDALRLINDTEYGLTSGIYTRSPEQIELFSTAVEAGNVYINRPITGAVVGRQPFGGMKLSGVGAKTGGPDYLLQFLDVRVIAENTMRRGFAPKIS